MKNNDPNVYVGDVSISETTHIYNLTGSKNKHLLYFSYSISELHLFPTGITVLRAHGVE